MLVRPARRLHSITGHNLQVRGIVELEVATVGPLRFHIVDNIVNELVIGTDLLRPGSGILNYRTNTFTWYDREWPITLPQGTGISGASDSVVATGYSEIDEIIKKYEP